MHPLDSFVALDRRQSLAQERPLAERCEGAAVYADIAGFTRLSESLAETWGARRGAEELTTLLNRIYSALVHEIHHAGGSVLGYEGDAIYGWFEGDDGRQAVPCARRMIAAVDRLGEAPMAGAAGPIGIRVAVTAGPLRRLVVGDPAVQLLDVAAGQTLSRLAEIGREAAVGEVRIDAATRLHAAAADVPAAEPPAEPNLAGEVLRPWVLPPVRRRVRAGHADYLAELRQVTVLFLHFEGLDYDDDPAVRAKLDRFVRHAQHTLAGHESYILYLGAGDKGSVLCAAFGAPIAHQDDPLRAVQAASELLSLPAELDDIRDLRVGISTGATLVGTYGCAARQTYSVLGDTVNVAARLMALAERGHALVTAEVARAAPGFAFGPECELRVKGRAAPVVVCTLQGRASAVVGRLARPMVGRHAERAVLAAALERVAGSGGGGVIVIEGEAGIGKSRLVEAALEQARARGLGALLAAADSIEQSTTYFAWRAALAELLGLGQRADRSERARAAMAELLAHHPDRERLETLVPLLDHILLVDLPDTHLSRQLVGEVRATNTQDLMLELLRAATRRARRPLRLLALDDAHWLDSASWTLLRRVTQELPELLVMVSTRPMQTPRPADYERIVARGECRVLVLDNLPPEATLKLIRRRLGVTDLPEEVDRFILARGEGHPLFCEELACALREAGLLRVEGETSWLTVAPEKVASLDFPTSVEGVITGRIDGLSDALQRTLKTASVIGRVFGYDVLHDVHPAVEERSELREQLDELMRLDITPRETEGPELTYVFKHVITQQVAYNQLLFAQRRQLHRAIAERYERVFAADLAPYYPLLVHHWRAAEDMPRAIEYLERAGEVALHEGAFAEGVQFFGEALERDARLPSPSPPTRRAHWHRLRADAYFGLGQMDTAVEEAGRAVALLSRPRPQSTLRWGLFVGQEALTHLLVLPLPWLFRARSPERRAQLAEEALAWERTAESHYFTFDVTPMQGSALRAVNLGLRAGTSARVARAYGMLGLVAGPLRLHGLARRYFRMTQQVAAQTDSLEDRAFGKYVEAAYLLGLGRWAELQRLCEESVALYNRLNNRQDGETAEAIKLLAHIWMCRFDDVLVESEALLASARARSNGQHAAWAIFSFARLYLRTGRPAEAVTKADEALCACREANDTASVVTAAGVGALARLRLGDVAGALAVAEVAGALVWGQPPTGVHILDGLEGLCETTLLAWEQAVRAGAPDTAALRRKAQQSDRAMTLFALLFPVGAPLRHVVHGRRLEIEGKIVRARRAFRRSLRCARDIGLPYFEGLALYHLGRTAGGRERSERLAAAAAVFERLGCPDPLCWIAQARDGQRAAGYLAAQG